MAKKKVGDIFTNCELDLENMNIIETKKDGVEIHSIMEVLEEYKGVEGLKISIGYDRDRVPKATEY